jgi:hypothetical protein
MKTNEISIVYLYCHIDPQSTPIRQQFFKQLKPKFVRMSFWLPSHSESPWWRRGTQVVICILQKRTLRNLASYFNDLLPAIFQNSVFLNDVHVVATSEVLRLVTIRILPFAGNLEEPDWGSHSWPLACISFLNISQLIQTLVKGGYKRGTVISWACFLSL